ncbi:ribbon-helix-helix domain-containing protein [Nitratireductor aquimarinus]|nr:ribbon-helix-helix domain-containing protein [Nitratireductor aquimarinus]MCA1262652.1 ribbon-helix-helix domain-containing protein [Nitratireductor aquimarinus]
MSGIAKRSVSIRGHRTSISLEKPFLLEMAPQQRSSVRRLSRRQAASIRLMRCRSSSGPRIFQRIVCASFWTVASRAVAAQFSRQALMPCRSFPQDAP